MQFWQARQKFSAQWLEMIREISTNDEKFFKKDFLDNFLTDR